jgi:H+/Na+-translocating ferredoxin:NAD+ oxidoreductase subunit D
MAADEKDTSKGVEPAETNAETNEAEEPAEELLPPTLSVASSPHARSSESTAKIMWTVFACLLPASAWSVYIFGMQAAIVLATCTGGAVVFEALVQYFTKDRTMVQDGSAALTGLLLGLTMPPGASVVICLIGAFVAVVVAKAIFGGLGHNPFNPALTARVFLLIAFPGAMTKWPIPLQAFTDKPVSLYGQATTWYSNFAANKTLALPAAKTDSVMEALAGKVDVITAATPLAVAKEHWQKGTGEVLHYTDYFVGSMPGSLGEVSVLLLLLGAAFLLIKGYITWHIPVSFILGVVIMAGLTHLASPTRYMDPIFHLVTGGIIIGAFFMATDYVTSPTYPLGMVIFGFGCGLLTMIIRLWAAFPEGVSFAILIMNALTPIIERYTRPKKYGLKPWAEPEASK